MSLRSLHHCAVTAAALLVPLVPSINAERQPMIVDACPSAIIERTDWEDLLATERACLASKGWTEDHWDCGWKEEDFLPWNDLPPNRKKAALARMWTKEEWEARRLGPPCVEEAEMADSVEDFRPVKIKVDVPALRSLTMDRLAEMYGGVSMRLVGGDAANATQVESCDERGADGYCVDVGKYASEDFLARHSMSVFIKSVKAGDTRHYAHLEEAMKEKELLWEGVGRKVVESLREFVSSDPRMLAPNGTWREEYEDFEEQDYDWAMFVGAKGTKNHMHYDSDTFNFLYLVEGRKRVVLIPNDARTKDLYEVRTNEDGGTAWVEEDILARDYILPDCAIDIILEAGEGLAIPSLAWHAVENLEASLAFGVRIL